MGFLRDQCLKTGRTFHLAAALAVLAGGSAVAKPTQADLLAEAPKHWGMLKTYCTGCHNTKARTGGLWQFTMPVPILGVPPRERGG